MYSAIILYQKMKYVQLLLVIGSIFLIHETHGLQLSQDLEDRPSALTQIVFDKVTPTTITFRLLGPGNAGGMPITHYNMKYRLADQKEDPVKEVTWERDTPYILGNLTPRAKYQFSAAAISVVGVGDYKDAIYVMPEETVPEQPNIKMQQESTSEYPDRFEVRWEEPDNNGKPILKYSIRYFKVEREPDGWIQTDKAIERQVDARDLSFEMTGLMPDSYYKVEIRATNEIGNSLPDSVVFKTSKDLKPDHPLAGSGFKCPLVFGVFPDPDDCAYYYICIAGTGVRHKCKFFYNFDILRRKCMPVFVAICGNDKDKTTTTSVTPTKSVTSQDDSFKCSSFTGSFPHPKDCSKYYSCFMFIPTLKTCPSNQLFDAVKKSCESEGKVHCGTRTRPDKLTTTAITATKSVSNTPEDDSFTCSSFMGSFPYPKDCSKYYSCFMYRHTLKTCPEKKLFDATKKSCESESKVDCGTRLRPGMSTTPIPPTTTPVTPTATKEEETETPTDVTETTEEVIITTTETFPTGPPEHDCDEDDVDCIITETGDPANWFKCPDDIASFPHPSSDKLFIFCMNWVPSVKKCGLDMVFSKELRTCVATNEKGKLL